MEAYKSKFQEAEMKNIPQVLEKIKNRKELLKELEKKSDALNERIELAKNEIKEFEKILKSLRKEYGYT